PPINFYEPVHDFQTIRRILTNSKIFDVYVFDCEYRGEPAETLVITTDKGELKVVGVGVLDIHFEYKRSVVDLVKECKTLSELVEKLKRLPRRTRIRLLRELVQMEWR
ncbi:hypothetical protein DRO54_06190, partial [Candidatus Bathyarchaeota archaeon]